ncbi:MAG TPA: HIT domain-containing protein, partial [Alphaproteobacteria bacterium]|nr:HIT domain-containing protein [Alphaproteobacteria bacterium]
MSAFLLHEKLAADTHLLCDLKLCRVLLMNDKRFPWLILVPRRDGLCEIVDLLPGEQAQVMEEISQASHALQTLF